MRTWVLPVPEKVNVGIYEDTTGEIFPLGQRYPGIVLLYTKIETVIYLVQLMRKLEVRKDELFLVNFEKLKDRFNIVVCFKIKRGNQEIVLIGEVEGDKEVIEGFKKYLQKTKTFVICLGVYDSDKGVVPYTDWYVLADSYDEYDGKSVRNYLCGRLH